MDVTVKGRGNRVAARTRTRMETKLARLSRLDERIDRVEVEVTFESRGRIGGGHRVEASCRSGRHTYRAHATGPDVDAAFDRLLERLERQISEEHRRRLSKRSASVDRVQSGRIGPNQESSPDLDTELE